MAAGGPNAAAMAKSLLAATKRGDVAETESLLDSGVPVDSADNVRALMQPVANGVFAGHTGNALASCGTKMLMGGFGKISLMQNAWTALIWASRGGNYAMARVLLDRGAAMDARDEVRMGGCGKPATLDSGGALLLPGRAQVSSFPGAGVWRQGRRWWGRG